MGVKYDCVTWSVDKNMTHMFEWYPESPSITRLPENYTVSVDNQTLIHKPSGTPMIKYADGEFKVLTNILDWEMYICLNRKAGFVTFENDGEVRIGAIVSGGDGDCLTTIRGNSTIIYHDSIWSEASIEIQGMKIKGNMDNVHGNLPFIYCHNFTATDVKIYDVNRIYAKGSITLKNVFIRDEADESKYVHDVLDRELMPGMYIRAGIGMMVEDSDIYIHNYIEGYMLTFVRSHVVVHNLVSQKLVINSMSRILLDNSALDVERSNNTDVATTLDLIYIKSGNLILKNDSRINAKNDAYQIMEYACITLGEGNIVISDSQIKTTAYPKAINMLCYGDLIVNPTGAAVRTNFGFAPLVSYREAFRFKTELNGYKMWVYVNGRTVTHVECISGESYLEDFEPKAYSAYVQSCLSRILPGPEGQNKLALMASTVPAGSRDGVLRIQAD